MPVILALVLFFAARGGCQCCRNVSLPPQQFLGDNCPMRMGDNCPMRMSVMPEMMMPVMPEMMRPAPAGPAPAGPAVPGHCMSTSPRRRFRPDSRISADSSASSASIQGGGGPRGVSDGGIPSLFHHRFGGRHHQPSLQRCHLSCQKMPFASFHHHPPSMDVVGSRQPCEGFGPRQLHG